MPRYYRKARPSLPRFDSRAYDCERSASLYAYDTFYSNDNDDDDYLQTRLRYRNHAFYYVAPFCDPFAYYCVCDYDSRHRHHKSPSYIQR